MQVSPEKFDAIFPRVGAELAAQFKWAETVDDWGKLCAGGLVSGKELGVDEKALVGLKESLKGMKGVLTEGGSSE